MAHINVRIQGTPNGQMRNHALSPVRTSSRMISGSPLAAGITGLWTHGGSPTVMHQHVGSMTMNPPSSGSHSYEPLRSSHTSAPGVTGRHSSPPPPTQNPILAEPNTARAQWMLPGGVAPSSRSSLEHSPQRLQQRMGSAHSLTAPSGASHYQHSTVSLPAGLVMPSGIASEEAAPTARLPVAAWPTGSPAPRLSGAVRQGSVGGCSTASMPCSSPGAVAREMKRSLPHLLLSEAYPKPELERETRKSFYESEEKMMQLLSEVHGHIVEKREQEQEEDKMKKQKARAALKSAEGPPELRQAILQAEDCHMPLVELQTWRDKLTEMERQSVEKEASQERLQLQQRISDLQLQLHQVTDDVFNKNKQIDDITERLHQVQSDLQNEEETNRQLRTDRDEAVCKMQEKLTLAQAAQAALSSRDQPSLESMQQQEENKSLHEENGQLKVRYNSLEKRFDSLTRENTELKRKKSDLEKERREEDAKLRETTKMKQVLEQELAILREKRFEEDQNAIAERNRKEAKLEERDRLVQEQEKLLQQRKRDFQEQEKAFRAEISAQKERANDIEKAAKRIAPVEKENRNMKQAIQEQKKVMWDLQCEKSKDQMSASFITPGEFFKLHQQQEEVFKSEFTKMANLQSQVNTLEFNLKRARTEVEVLRKHIPPSVVPNVESELVARTREPAPEPER
mmetsp:Transcript_100062/g.177541  ORF Transcript_100062/g.177541 Transcript_100062/m.177541 type:complete len:683 (+) Transcript_100062:59-2107(+)